MCLDTAYFTENRKLIAENKKKKKKYIYIYIGLKITIQHCTLITFQHCTLALIHCSCPMNSARGTGQKKKKKRGKNADVKRNHQYPNIA